MTTQQNDTAALTDEQLDAVSGSIRPIPSPGPKGNYVGGVRSSNPTPHPSPFFPRPGAGSLGVVDEPRPVW